MEVYKLSRHDTKVVQNAINMLEQAFCEVLAKKIQSLANMRKMNSMTISMSLNS